MAKGPITDKYGDPDLNFDGRKVAVECKPISNEAEAMIKNYAAKNDPGSAEITVVVAAVDKLYVDEEVVELAANRQQKPYRAEDGTSLVEFLLMYIVDHEPWLASKKKWPQIFGKYLNNPFMAEQNPTKAQAGAKQAS